MTLWQISILCMLSLLIGVVIYQIRMDFYNRKRMFDIQIEMAQAQQMMTKDLAWKDLKIIINDVISFRVSHYIMVNGISKMSDDELSVMWVVILQDVCTEVEISLSDEIKRQALKSITEDYYTQFIKNSVEMVIVYQLEQNKDNKYNNRLSKIQQTISRVGETTTKK